MSGYLSSIRVSEIIWIVFDHNKILNENGAFLFIILKISKATVRILRVLKEGNFDFSNRNS